MRTVKEVSQLTGVSVRTLHYYDSIGLLRPTQTTESGYRLYDDTALERLQLILLYRTLGFPLREIGEILDSPDFDRDRALEQQIILLQMQKAHLENLIDFARGIQAIGVKALDFSAFDTTKIDDYAAQAKAMYGKTEAYREYAAKAKNRTPEEETQLQEKLLAIFSDFGAVRDLPPESDTVQMLVERLRQFITAHFYDCTPQVLQMLGKMYAGGGKITEAIEETGGKGTAALVAAAIQVYCHKK